MQPATAIAFSGFVSGVVIVIGRRYLSGVLWHPRTLLELTVVAGTAALVRLWLVVATWPRPQIVMNWREWLGLDGRMFGPEGNPYLRLNQSDRRPAE